MAHLACLTSQVRYLASQVFDTCSVVLSSTPTTDGLYLEGVVGKLQHPTCV